MGKFCVSQKLLTCFHFGMWAVGNVNCINVEGGRMWGAGDEVGETVYLSLEDSTNQRQFTREHLRWPQCDNMFLMVIMGVNTK